MFALELSALAPGTGPVSATASERRSVRAQPFERKDGDLRIGQMS